jgi:hypothetical protein
VAQRADERADEQEPGRDHEHQPLAVQVAQPAGDRHGHGRGQQRRGQQPLGAGGRAADVLGDAGSTGQELRLARQLAARRGADPARPSTPDWRTRLLVARAVAGLRVWLDDITAGDCADPWRHLEQIFGTEPLLAGRDGV